MARLTRNELIAMLGALLLGGGLFLNWYQTDSALASLNGHRGVNSYTGFEIHPIMRWVLLIAAIAPFVLAYIVARDHKLSWARGELTAVIAIAALGLVLYNGVIGRPGDPASLVSLCAGWYVAFAGTVLMLAGSALRSGESERRRKPPGTI